MWRVKQHSLGNVRMRRGQVHDTVSGLSRKSKFIRETNPFNLRGGARKSLKEFAITEEKVLFSICEDLDCGYDIAQAVNNIAGKTLCLKRLQFVPPLTQTHEANHVTAAPGHNFGRTTEYND